MAKTKNKSKGGGSKREKPFPFDEYLKPLAGILLALVGYHVFRGMLAKEIIRVDVTETGTELELREVLFGEDETTGNNQNYAVLCYPDDKTAPYPISSVFQDAANDGTAPCEFRLLDCDTVVSFSESQKSITERFNFSTKTKPIVFVSGSIGTPKQVPAKFLKTGTMLTKALKNLLEPRAVKIETTQDLRTKCLDKDVCGLLLKGSKTSPKYVQDAVRKLVVEHPRVTFASVDSSVLYVKGLEAEFLPELTPGIPRFVVFQKKEGTTDASKNNNKKDTGRLKTTAVALDVDVAYGPMSNLVGAVVSGKKGTTMKKVTTTPTIKTRTKKLEKEENAKRQRAKDRASGGSSSSSSSSGGGGAFHSGENDGSPEGRKAERERRRAEHRKNNPNYKEKTPEEIKEMERQRRIRMEEEASKWNMDPEDMDEDGGDGDGAGDAFMDEEDWDEDDLDADDSSSDGDDDDGEEVMDLD